MAHELSPYRRAYELAFSPHPTEESVDAFIDQTNAKLQNVIDHLDIKTMVPRFGLVHFHELYNCKPLMRMDQSARFRFGAKCISQLPRHILQQVDRELIELFQEKFDMQVPEDLHVQP